MQNANIGRKGEEGAGLLWKTILLVLAAICIVTLLVFFNKVIGILKPEKVSVEAAKTLIAEIEDLRKEIDNTEWKSGEERKSSITVPLQLKANLRIRLYKNGEGPAEMCKKAACVGLLSEEDKLYVGSLTKDILFTQIDTLKQGNGAIQKYRIEMEQTDGSYVASVVVDND